MKTTRWLMLITLLSAAVLAGKVLADEQPDAKAPPDAKAKRTPDKKSGGTKKADLTAEPLTPAEPLSPGPAVVRQNNVNVRGKAAINSEVLTRLKKGDHVIVLEEVTLKKPKTDEPAKWARIALPTNSTAWVHNSFIDPAQKTVVPKRLNLRSGPGENYSVIGRIDKGTVIKEVETKGDWIRIEPPADAYGFVAAHLLAKEPAAAPPPVVAATPPPVAPAAPPPIVTTEPAQPAGAPTVTPVATPTPPAPAAEPVTPPVVATPPAAPPAVAVEPPPAPEPQEEILVKRVVSREGVVKRSVSIQAPTYFSLTALDTGKTINYVFSPTNSNVVLKDYFGQRVIVTGEELLDERWPNTPVITVDSIEAVP